MLVAVKQIPSGGWSQSTKPTAVNKIFRCDEAARDYISGLMSGVLGSVY
jgi:hypothetical protein